MHLMTIERVEIGGGEYFVARCLNPDCRWEGQPCVTRQDAAQVRCAVFQAIREGWKNKAKRRELTAV